MHRVARLYEGLHALIGLLCGFLIGAIALGITVDVLLRNMRRIVDALQAIGITTTIDVWFRDRGLGSLPWLMEVNEYALYVVTALGAPWALRRGAHVRVDLLVRGLPFGAARWIEMLTDLIGLATSAVLLYYAIDVAREARRGGARVIKELIFPEWWVFAVIALGALLLMVEFGRRFHQMWHATPAEIAARRL